MKTIYVITVRGAIPVDIGHKIACAHAEALKHKNEQRSIKTSA